MISEERLKELLKEEATIYRVNGYVEEIGLNEYDFETTDKELVFNYKVYAIRLEDLFETEEEAKEYLKYGNITRMEKFPYVSWEEVCDGTDHHIIFTTPHHEKIEMIICDCNIDIISIYNSISDFSKPLTKENWFKALDLAVKLFRGEEV